MTTTTELVAVVSFTGGPELIVLPIVLPYDVDLELDDDDVLIEVYRSVPTALVHVEPWDVVDDNGVPVFDPTLARKMLAEAGYRVVVGKEWEPTNDGYCRTVKLDSE